MAQLMNFAPVVLKNLFSKPVTKNYPAEPAVYPERSRGHVEIDLDTCIMCGLCMRSCPSGSIKVDRPNATWTINRFDCVQCGYCTTVCPKKSLSINPGYQEPGEEKFEASYVKPQTEAPAPAAKPAAPAPAAKPAAAPQADNQ